MGGLGWVLTGLMGGTFVGVHYVGCGAFAAERARRGWDASADARATSQRFWDLAFGISLRVGATGGAAALAASEMKMAMRADARAQEG